MSLPSYLTLERHVPGSPSTARLVGQSKLENNFCTSWKNSSTVSPFPVKKVAIQERWAGKTHLQISTPVSKYTLQAAEGKQAEPAPGLQVINVPCHP